MTNKGKTVYPFLLRSRSTKTDKSVLESRENFPESPIFNFNFFEIGQCLMPRMFQQVTCISTFLENV